MAAMAAQFYCVFFVLVFHFISKDGGVAIMAPFGNHFPPPLISSLLQFHPPSQSIHPSIIIIMNIMTIVSTYITTLLCRFMKDENSPTYFPLHVLTTLFILLYFYSPF